MNKVYRILITAGFVVVYLFQSNIWAEATDKIPIVWFLQMGSDEQESDSAFFQYVENYNQSQDSIELILDITSAGCSFDAADTLLSRIANNNSPDFTSLRYRELWDDFIDLRPYLQTYDLSGWDTTYFYLYNYNDHLIHLPLVLSTNLLFYNKAMFDSAGLDYPPHQYEENYADGDLWDIGKLEEIAILLTVDENGHNAYHEAFDSTKIVQYGFHWAWNNGIGFNQMFGSPDFINPDGTIEIPEYMRQGYHWAHQGIWQKHFIPSEEIFVNKMNANPLGSGQCAMVLTGSYYASYMDSTIEWDIAAVPQYNGIHNLSWGTGGFSILNTCEHPDKAMAVILTIANTFEYYAGSFQMPSKTGFQSQMGNSWESRYPDVDHDVFLAGLDHLSPLSDAQAVQYKMEAWRLFNDYRGYLREYPDADLDGALDSWLIPQLENIFKVTKVNDSRQIIPEQCILYQNYPNPFNNMTTLSFQIHQACKINLTIYTLLGQEVITLIDDHKTAGQYQIQWDASAQSSGVYFYSLTTDKGYKQTKKLLLIK
ncbi:MAG TPA: extracellular solute-binding protein [Caldithrix sp.]|nr:extracellular solute-binding protein [Caldithrix sp.]